LWALLKKLELGLLKKLKNPHVKSQLSSFCSFRNLSAQRTGGHTASDPDQKYIFFIGPSTC